MNFPYTRVTDLTRINLPSRILPWLPIEIFTADNPDNRVTPLGLVDSGADVNMINIEIGKYLGLKLEGGKEHKIFGLGGGVVTGFEHKVMYQISDPEGKEKSIIYEDIAVFTKDAFPPSTPQQTAIWGTVGFFRNTIVSFNFPDNIEVLSAQS